METEYLQPTRNFLSTFFITMGILFIIIVATLVYLVVADPFELRPMLFDSAQVPREAATAGMLSGEVAPADTSTNELVLSSEQKDALQKYGIDPSTIPTTITPLQLVCFEEKLGTSRVTEIRMGGVPTAFELLRVKSCIGQ